MKKISLGIKKLLTDNLL